MSQDADKLIAVLKSEAPQKEKVDACRRLGVIGGPEAVPALAGLLGDEKLSHMARYGLEPNPDPGVEEALRSALGRLKGRPLIGVIGSLGVRRDPKAVGPLAGLIGDPEPIVGRTAARALGRIGTSEAGAALKEKLSSAPAQVRAAVADGCLACAERLLAVGKRSEAAALYESVGKAEVPAHMKKAGEAGIAISK